MLCTRTHTRTHARAHTHTHTHTHLIIQRVRTHFDPIMKVVNSLVSNLPTNGAPSSGKLLKALPNSDALIKTVMKSCDRLVEHYQNHEKFTIEMLQAEVEAGTRKKRKEEVSIRLYSTVDMYRAMGNFHFRISQPIKNFVSHEPPMLVRMRLMG